MANGFARFLSRHVPNAPPMATYRAWQKRREDSAFDEEALALDEQIAAANLPPVEISAAEALATGYENLNDFRKARLASGQHWNAEEEVQVAQQMGPIGQSAIDMSRVRSQPDLKSSGSSFIAAGSYDPSYDQISMLPDSGGTNQHYLSILGHEFTHRDHMTKGIDPLEEKILGSTTSWNPSAHPMLRNFSNLMRMKAEGNLEGYASQRLFNFAKEGAKSEMLANIHTAWRASSPEEWDDIVWKWNTMFPPQKHLSQRERSDRLGTFLDDNRETLLALEVEEMDRQHQARLATLDERGLPYDAPTEEQNAAARARNLDNRSNQADFRARMTGRLTDPVERAYGGGVYG